VTALGRLLVRLADRGQHRATAATRPEHRASKLIEQRAAFTAADRRRASAVAS